MAALRKAWQEDLPKAIRAEMRAEVLATAREVSDTQRAAAPVSQDETPGQLRDSHHVEMDEGGLKAAMVAGGPEAPHGLHVEFGTVNMAAEPWFYPIWRLMRKRAKGRLNRAFGRAIKKVRSNG